jgi:transposase InsO family protein
VNTTNCQQLKGSKNNHHQISSTAGDAPFKRVAMDYFDPLPQSSKENTYILVIIDTFSKYVEIYPVKSTRANELASTFYYKFILRHGLPQEVSCDNGPPFSSELIQELAKYTQVNINYTPPYHPQSNGIVERFMKTLR